MKKEHINSRKKAKPEVIKFSDYKNWKQLSPIPSYIGLGLYWEYEGTS